MRVEVPLPRDDLVGGLLSGPCDLTPVSTGSVRLTVRLVDDLMIFCCKGNGSPSPGRRTDEDPCRGTNDIEQVTDVRRSRTRPELRAVMESKTTRLAAAPLTRFLGPEGEVRR